MEAGTQQGELPGTTATRGRKDRGGQEIVIKLTELKSRMPNLLSLHKKANAAKDALQDAIKASAEASGTYASEVSAYVKAASGDTDAYEAKKAKAKQRALIFDELNATASPKNGETKQ